MSRSSGFGHRVSLRLLALMAVAAVGLGVLQAPAGAVTSSSGQPARPSSWTRLSALSPAEVSDLAAGADRRVIVMLRNQALRVNPGLAHLSARTLATAHAEQAVVSELKQLNVPRLHSYNLISAVAATVSPAEKLRLSQDPAVAEVVPDRVVRLQPDTTHGQYGTASTSGSAATAKVNRVPGTCPKNPRKPLFPEYLSVMHAAAAQKIVSGRGVRVAVFPDGMDPKIRDFQRNGHSIIFDYRDFSGDGTKAVTNGEEAFGDVSSIAAQGKVTYDLSKEVNPKTPLPAHCNIRVRGVAPGASVAMMKVFGNADSAFNSTILQGMDWAVSHDHVDVLSESVGGNPLPSVGTDDPMGAFDAAAVRNGITVVASTGDAGTTNTIGSPANVPGVIGAAGTTTYQIYAQTSSYGAQLGDQHGWEHSNIAPISSSGVTQRALTATVAAPADGNWADCSRKTKRYTACADLYRGAKKPQPIVPFGGTSESCPLTAGAAALVIQAYRKTHNGATPSPATVKRILASTATDIHAAGIDEGSGLVNAYRAVKLAESMPGRGKHHRTGRGLLISTNQVSRTAAPGSRFSFRERVRNLGTHRAAVRPQLTAFSTPRQLVSRHLFLSKKSKKFLFLGQAGSVTSSNYRVPYMATRFTVRPGYDRLLTRVAWNADIATGMVRASLFDPRGKMIANSRPQGTNGGFGEIQDNHPMAGTYKLVVFSTTRPLFHGKVAMKVYGEVDRALHGAVSPASASIRPGRSRTFTVRSATPAQPGDASQTLRFGRQAGVVPVIERSLIEPRRSKPAHFSTRITGGNARGPLYGLAQDWQFQVRGGIKDIDVDLSVPHSGYELLGLLVDPKGVAQDVTSSVLVNRPNSATGSVRLLRTEHLSWANPQKGRWTLIAAVGLTQASGLTSTTLKGTVSFNRDKVTQTGLPTSSTTRLTPGKTRTVKLKVRNTGNTPKYYFVDPRTDSYTTITPSHSGKTSGRLPIPLTANIAQFIVPPFSTVLNIVAHSSPPATSPTSPAPRIDFDSSPAFGSPDQMSTTGTTAVMSMVRPDLTASEYSCTPTIVKRGGFRSRPTKGGRYSCGAQVTTRAFDPNVRSSTGDLYKNPHTWKPIKIAPHKARTITVTITSPATTSAKTESGILPVLSFDPVTVTDDVWKIFHYTYTAAPSGG